MMAAGRQCSIVHAISRGAEKVLTPTVMAPSLPIAKAATSHSGRLGRRTATRSPFQTPTARSARASSSARAWRAPYVSRRSRKITASASGRARAGSSSRSPSGRLRGGILASTIAAGILSHATPILGGAGVVEAPVGQSRPAVPAAMVALVTGCMVGPDYVRPTVITPDAYKEGAGWKVARPQDDAPRGAWWEVFADPQLNALAAQVSVSNQNLAVAKAQFRQARALVREARAAYFPTVTLGLGFTRSRQSSTFVSGSGGGSTGGVSSSGASSVGSSGARSDFTVGLDFSWELAV